MKKILIRGEEIYHKIFETRMLARLEQWIVPSLRERGFKESYIDPIDFIVIYDSPQCRIRFQLGENQYQPEKDIVSVAYGRLQAPDEGDFIKKNGKRYKRTWFTVRRDQILDFLDGNNPVKVASLWVNHKIRQMAWNKVYQQIVDIEVPSPFVRELLFHDKIWQLYGEKLFALFDMKNEEAWNAFRSFLEDYYMEWDYLDQRVNMLKSYGDNLYPWDIH